MEFYEATNIRQDFDQLPLISDVQALHMGWKEKYVRTYDNSSKSPKLRNKYDFLWCPPKRQGREVHRYYLQQPARHCSHPGRGYLDHINIIIVHEYLSFVVPE